MELKITRTDLFYLIILIDHYENHAFLMISIIIDCFIIILTLINSQDQMFEIDYW